MELEQCRGCRVGTPGDITEHPSRAQGVRASPRAATTMQPVLNKSSQKRRLCVSANDVALLKHPPVQGILGVMSVEHHPAIVFISAEKEQNSATREVTTVFSKHQIRETWNSSQFLARLIHFTSGIKTYLCIYSNQSPLERAWWKKTTLSVQMIIILTHRMRFPSDSTMEQVFVVLFWFSIRVWEHKAIYFVSIRRVIFFCRKAKVFYKNILNLIKPIMCWHLHFMDLIVFLDKRREIITNSCG